MSDLQNLPKNNIILDLCGGTGAWSKPYKDAGYDVRLITLPEHDVRLYKPPENVYGILAAPPCTHLAGSGARWWKSKGEEVLLEALSIVDACMRIILLSKPNLALWGMFNKPTPDPLLNFEGSKIWKMCPSQDREAKHHPGRIRRCLLRDESDISEQ